MTRPGATLNLIAFGYLVMVTWKPVVLSVALAGLGMVTPAMMAPQLLQADVFAQTAVAPTRPLTVIMINNAGVPVLAGESGKKTTTLGPGKSTSLAFPPIKNYRDDVNILVYNPNGTRLIFRTSNYNSRTNTLTVTVVAAQANNPNVHGSISIGPKGVVRYI